jgi:hypothetical protein
MHIHTRICTRKSLLRRKVLRHPCRQILRQRICLVVSKEVTSHIIGLGAIESEQDENKKCGPM